MKSRLQALGPIGVSLLLHAVLGWGLVRGHTPGSLGSEQASPPPLRFELVDSPDSAISDQSPDNSQNYSNKTTRAQDPTEKEADEADNHRPTILDEGEQKDLRPVAQMAQTAQQSAEAQQAPSLQSGSPESSVEKVVEELPDVKPSEQGELALQEEKLEESREPAHQEESTASPAIPEIAPAGASQQGRRNPSPAERDELARTLATGEFSYEATEHFFANYLLNLRERVDVQWTLQLMGDFMVPGKREAVVDFLVLADGSVAELRTRKLIGAADFASICTKSIRAAAPFGPVPYGQVPGMSEAIEGKPLRIRFTFTYY